MKNCFSTSATNRITRRWYVRIIAIGIMFLIAMPAALPGQNADWVVFDMSNSALPDNNVLSLAIDSYNNKWIGTKFGGLVKFDGEDWEIFMPDSAILFPPIFKKSGENLHASDRAEKIFVAKNAMTSGPQFNAFYDLAIDANDTKWIGSKIGGLIRFNGVEWKVFNADNSGIPDNYAWSLALDEKGDKWIGTKKGGVTKFDGSKWIVYDQSNSALPDNDVCSVSIDKNGTKWIGTARGLAKFDGKNWTVYRTDNSRLPANTVWALANDHQNNIWIGTRGGGLAKFDGVNWKVYNRTNSNLPSNDISALAFEYSSNSVWIGTFDAGLINFNGLNWKVFDTLNSGLPQNNIKDMLIDNQGNKWIGTELGLAIYREDGVVLTKSKESFNLFQNYPNPFNAGTEFYFDIPRRTWVTVSIHNLIGQLVQTLANEEYYPGTYHAKWDGLTKDGRPAPGGLYVYRIKTDFGARSKKMILLR